jgi:ABC-type transporter Mla subunit MlaD
MYNSSITDDMIQVTDKMFGNWNKLKDIYISVLGDTSQALAQSLDKYGDSLDQEDIALEEVMDVFAYQAEHITDTIKALREVVRAYHNWRNLTMSLSAKAQYSLSAIEVV